MLGSRWVEKHAALFGWMAGRHGVDWSRVSGLAEALAMRHAVNACLSCRDVDACQAAFDGAADAGTPDEFCANRRLFERWSGERPAG